MYQLSFHVLPCVLEEPERVKSVLQAAPPGKHSPSFVRLYEMVRPAWGVWSEQGKQATTTKSNETSGNVYTYTTAFHAQ